MAQLQRLTVGKVFAKDFRVVRPLSEGGMGAVYVVEQLSTGSERALKLMHPHLVQDARLRQRFEQEARVASRIESDHIVQVMASGVDDETGMPWLAMELLKGDDLASALARRGVIPPAEVGEIFSQLCHALGAAHAAGIVHRDLKPENIFLAASRREGSRFSVKVLDFGIARMTEEAKTALTGAIGTPLWMAPEQTSASTSITPAADVWALGLIAFRMLTGKAFWMSANVDADTMMLLREIVIDSVPTASSRAAQLGVGHLLPAGFDAWFARCVDRDHTARFANASEVRAALAPVLAAAHTPAYGEAATALAPETAAAPPTRDASSIAHTPQPRTDSGWTPLGMEPRAPAPFAAPAAAVNATPYGLPPGVASNAAPFGALPGAAPNAAQYGLPGHTVQGAAPVLAATPVRATTGTAAPAKGGAGKTIAIVAIGVAVIGGAILGGRAYRSHAVAQKCEAAGASQETRLDACSSACDGGVARACVLLGDAQVKGKAAGRFDDAATSYRRACDGGALAGCRRLGRVLERAATKSGTVEAHYKRACDGGDLTGCTLLGAAHARGRGVAADAVKAIGLYQKACDGGDALGCAYLGAATDTGRGTKRDAARATTLYARAVEPLHKACDGGEMLECAALGMLTDAGLGVARDGARAVTLHQRACDGGEPLGCGGLGAIQAAGRDAAGRAGAASLLQEACDASEPSACHNLALLRSNARVVVRRGAPASVFFECETPSCGGESAIPIDLQGGPRDASASAALLAKACDGGQSEGCVALGKRHLTGRDVEKSKERAKALFQRACERGDADGCGAQRTIDMPFEASQKWRGKYLCPQGATALVLQMTKVDGRRVEGIFDFNHAPTGTTGKFKIAGNYDPATSFIKFDPGDWILRPAGYVTVGLEGTVDGSRFAGKIANAACQSFDVDLAPADGR